MEKHTITERMEAGLGEYDEPITVKEARRRFEAAIAELMRRGVKENDISIQGDCYLVATRLETDAEASIRIAKAEEAERIRQKRYEEAALRTRPARKRLYEELKREFGEE